MNRFVKLSTHKESLPAKVFLVLHPFLSLILPHKTKRYSIKVLFIVIVIAIGIPPQNKKTSLRERERDN